MTGMEYRKWRFHAESLIQQAIDIPTRSTGISISGRAGDDEPSLAAPAGGASQIVWCAGCDDNRKVSVGGLVC